MIFSIKVFAGFFAIMNPVIITSYFNRLTDKFEEKLKKEIARRSTITALVLLITIIFVGKYIFEFFNLPLSALKISGGIVVFYMGFEFIMSNKPKLIHFTEEISGKRISITPIAIPIIAGPGAIITSMNFTTETTYIHIIIVITLLILLILLTYLSFIKFSNIDNRFGKNNIAVLGKLNGLILSILGTEMVIDGIKLVLKEFNLNE